MHVLCVARHPYLSEHLCRFFETLEVRAVGCVGLQDAVPLVVAHDPDAVICDYDLLVNAPLALWEQDPRLARVPLIAVSLTRHPGEAHLSDSSIAGFLYLPTLDPSDARRLLDAVCRQRGAIDSSSVPSLPWPATTSLAPHR